MNRWVYWVSLGAIVVVVGFPLYGILVDPQANLSDLFRLGIDLQGGTSLIYELRPPEGGVPPDAQTVRPVIMNRIDPQGTRGYTVRPIGAHRLEIILPGRQTRVRIEPQAVTAEMLDAAITAAGEQDRAATADAIRTNRDAFLAGTRLRVRLRPSLYLDDIENRLSEKVRSLPAQARVPIAVVGLERESDRWQSVAVLLAVAPTDTDTLNRWRDLITEALATQRDVTRVKRLVGQAGFLEFRIMADRQADKDRANFERIIRRKQAGQPPDDPRFKWYPLKKGWEWYKQGKLDAWNFVYVVDEETQTVEALVDVSDGQDVTGKDLGRAYPSSQNGEPIVVFDLKPEAGARMARLTRPEMRDRQMAIILDGVIQSAPVLRATLSTSGIIEGYRGRPRERDEVVTILNSGQLAASLGDPVTERTVGPELGADNIHRGFVASVIGFGLVIVFILIYYRFAGIVADIALVLNLVLIVCIMSLVRQAWTLPGIAGLVLSLSMAIDANVLIFERLREEKGKEGSLPFAIRKAYQQAFRTIFDANLTTLIPAFVLLWPGLSTEEVKGFAVVMIIGIMVSMFTAVVVSRLLFETAVRWGIVRDVGMFAFFTHPKVRWMRFARPALVISGTAAALGLILFVSRGDEKYDIEFTGGTQVELALKVQEGQQGVSIEIVRRRATEALGPPATVQELEYAYEPVGERVDRFLISVPAVSEVASDEESVKKALAQAFADMRPERGTTRVTVEVSELTEDIVRERMRQEGVLPGEKAAPEEGGGALPPAGQGPAGEAGPSGATTSDPPPPAETPPEAAAPSKPPAETGAAAPKADASSAGEEAPPAESAPVARYIPPRYREYLGMTRLTVTVTPPMAPDEVRRRIDAFLRDRYPDVFGTPYEVKGTVPGDRPGEFKTLELWVRQEFASQRGTLPYPEFWSEVAQRALGTEQEFASTTSFEKTMGEEAWDKAVMAILLSLALMIVYIWVRFAQFSSGVAAVIALVHDVVITLGAVSVAALLADTVIGDALLLSDFRINLPMIGAFLTLVGYSINDTIVVFDRIRENRGRHGKMSVSVVNNSISHPVSRTILTSTTTFLAVTALYILAGRTSTVHGLAFVMLFGTIVGTYSSIAIASPILVLRDYLYRVYVWVYPIVLAGVWAYLAFLWQGPAVFFGIWQGWVATVAMLGWLVVTWPFLRRDAQGEVWPIAEKQPMFVQTLAGLSVLGPIGALVLGLATALAPGEAGYPAWTGPVAVAAAAVTPLAWALSQAAWGNRSRKN